MYSFIKYDQSIEYTNICSQITMLKAIIISTYQTLLNSFDTTDSLFPIQ